MSHKIGNRIITERFQFPDGYKALGRPNWNVHVEDRRRKAVALPLFRLQRRGGDRLPARAGRQCHRSANSIPGQDRQEEVIDVAGRSSITSSVLRLARDYNPAFLFSILAGLLAIPGIGILGWVLVERYVMGVMHVVWAIAGAVLLLFSAIAVSAGALSLLMKRMETRLSKRIRE